MKEFRDWQGNEPKGDGRERIQLWVVGAPGTGKSTIAAYFVDFIICLNKEAIVAYFFCKSGNIGLTTPADIIRTLAYQCMGKETEIRSSLEALREAGFKIDSNLGIHLLCQKLLQEPLQRTKRPIYIILDGLDEADRTKDCVDGRRPAMELLIECLSNLPLARLLLICRPESVFSKFKQQSIIRSISFNDNKNDIETYVRRRLSESANLRNKFEKEDIDPIKFFLGNSNGIFLWIVLLIEQLSQAEFRSEFQTYIHDVTRAPTDMTRLYLTILQSFSDEQRKWVKEILRWIVAAKRTLAVEELQTAVELCLQDESNNFYDFLELRCGSIFRLVQVPWGRTEVELIHETLRFLLLDPKRCPAEFYMDMESAHSSLVLGCLESLVADRSKSNLLHPYAGSSWVYHLIHSQPSEKDDAILLGLYRLFQPMNLRLWLLHGLLHRGQSSNLEPEAEYLRDVYDWLKRFRVSEGVHQSDLHCRCKSVEKFDSRSTRTIR